MSDAYQFKLVRKCKFLPVTYARKYWAKHLALVPFTNFNLLERFVSDYDGLGERMTWKQTLEDLGHCYFTLPLDGADAHLVVKWLRVCRHFN